MRIIFTMAVTFLVNFQKFLTAQSEQCPARFKPTSHSIQTLESSLNRSHCQHKVVLSHSKYGRISILFNKINFYFGLTEEKAKLHLYKPNFWSFYIKILSPLYTDSFHTFTEWGLQQKWEVLKFGFRISNSIFPSTFYCLSRLTCKVIW